MNTISLIIEQHGGVKVLDQTPITTPPDAEILNQEAKALARWMVYLDGPRTPPSWP